MVDHQQNKSNFKEDQQPHGAIARDDYTYSVRQAVNYFLQHGFRLAPRTVSWYCQTELLDCKKYACGSALKWKVTKQSIDERIETLEREGNAVASNNLQEPASLPAGNSEQQHAPASELATEIINVMRGELDAKNKQIDEFQSIMKDHNKQFENLNHTIQLSNETIQQLNKTLALPQVKEVMDSMGQEKVGWREGREEGAKSGSQDSAVNDWSEEQ